MVPAGNLAGSRLLPDFVNDVNMVVGQGERQRSASVSEAAKSMSALRIRHCAAGRRSRGRRCAGDRTGRRRGSVLQGR